MSDKFEEISVCNQLTQLRSLLQDMQNQILSLKSQISDSETLIQEVMLEHEYAIEPTRGSEFSACYDLYSCENYVLAPGSTTIIKTGVSIAWNNPKYYLQILPRSGMSCKGLSLGGGVVDIDYKKPIGVILSNNSNKEYIVERSDRVAQYNFTRIAEISETYLVTQFGQLFDSSRNGGFGSTGL